jgi:hypothetical protein
MNFSQFTQVQAKINVTQIGLNSTWSTPVQPMKISLYWKILENSGNLSRHPGGVSDPLLTIRCFKSRGYKKIVLKLWNPR